MKVELNFSEGKSLKAGILELISNFLDSYTKPQPKLLGLMTRQEVIKDLNISYNTLLSWERAGLRTYSPPLANTKIIYYHQGDILRFLGVENG